MGSTDLCNLPFSVGRPKHVRVMAGALEGDIFIGPKAEVRKPILCIYLSLCECRSCSS